MANFTGSSWRRIGPKVRQRIRERLPDAPQLLHRRLSVPCVAGIGAGLFLLPYVLWWLTAPTRSPTPPRTPDGVEVHQVLTALHTVLAEPALGRLPDGTPVPFALRDVEVEIHFVVQKSTPAGGDNLYRLVPVDTAVQARPEHVQTLKMRLLPTPPLPSQMGVTVSSTAAPPAAEEAGVRKPALAKKRDRP